MPKPMRSLLFAPGDDMRKMRRALGSGADVVIFDLEDSVAPARKAEARVALAQLVQEIRPPCWAIRINASDSAEHLDDVLLSARLAPDFLMLPKCRGLADLIQLDAQLRVLEHAQGWAQEAIRLLPLMTETASAVAALGGRTAPARVAALVFAAEDLAADLGIAARNPEGRLHPMLCDAQLQLLWAAAEAGLPAIDTPYPDPRDLPGQRREADAAMALGFVGKLCIHPAQIEQANAVFCPPAERLAWARAVVTLFAADPDLGVAMLGGQMVDKAHLRLAQRLLTLGGAA
jgi:citrate lyase subunit beta/citryl-CoA lyase